MSTSIRSALALTALALTAARPVAAQTTFTYTLTVLGTLGGTISVGRGVNASGQVTGYSYTTGNAAQHAFFYSGGMMTDLNTLIASGTGFTLTDATGISDTSFIANSSGQRRAFLLTPNSASAAPEPSQLAGLAFAGLYL